MAPAVFSLALSLLCIGIGLYEIQGNRRSKIHQQFFAVSIVLSLYVLGVGIAVRGNWSIPFLAVVEILFVIALVLFGFIMVGRYGVFRKPVFWMLVILPITLVGYFIYLRNTMLLTWSGIFLMIPWLAFLYVIHDPTKFLQIKEAMFDQLRELVVLVDDNGYILETNNRLKVLLGYEPRDIVGKKIHSLFSDVSIKDIRNLATNRTSSVVNITTVEGNEIAFHVVVSFFETRIDTRQYLLLANDIRLIQNLKKEVEERKEAQLQSKQSDDLFRVMVEMLPHAIFMTRIQDDIVMYVNTQASSLFRADIDEIIGTHAYEFYADWHNRADLKQELLSSTSPGIKRELIFRRRDGTTFVGEFTVQKVLYENVEVLLFAIADVSMQRYLQDAALMSERLLRSFMDAIPDYVVVSDKKGTITYTNMFTKSALDRNESLPSHFFDLGWINRDEIIAVWQHCIKKEYQFETERYFDEETKQMLSIKANVLLDQNDSLSSVIFVMRDVTQRRITEAALLRSKQEIQTMNEKLMEANSVLTQKTIRDSLTDLFNLKHISALLAREIQARITDENDSPLSIMMLDIDHFKRVNDTYGHLFGDEVLKRVASIIQSCLRSSDYPGRYGGEEFIVILPGVNAKIAYTIAQRIRTAVEISTFEEMPEGITISIGVTELKGKKEEALNMIHRVDELMYRAKRGGRNRVEMDEEAVVMRE